MLNKIIVTNEYPDKCATKGLHPNLFPKGWREITLEDFSQSAFFTYSPTHMEYRQMYPHDDQGNVLSHHKMIAAKLFHFPDGTGFAMSSEFWDKKVRYFQFGCDHSWKELMPSEANKKGITHFGMCYHVYECDKCNETMAQDSSG